MRKRTLAKPAPGAGRRQHPGWPRSWVLGRVAQGQGRRPPGRAVDLLPRLIPASAPRWFWPAAALILLALAAGGCRKKAPPTLPTPPPPQAQGVPQPERAPAGPEAQAEKAPREKGEGKPSEENQPAGAPPPAAPPTAAAARHGRRQSSKQETKAIASNRTAASLPSANQPAAGQPPANQPVANQPPPQLEAELNPQQARLYRNRAQETITETKRHFALLKEKRLSTEQQATLKQAQAFLSQARQALAANDLIRGVTLAQKAHVLSLELLRSAE